MSSSRGALFAALILAAAFLWVAPRTAAQATYQQLPPQQPRPRTTPESVAQGKALFEGTCANCHGIDGSGANGPNIREAATNLGPEGLYARIRGGVIGSGMPSFTTLDDNLVWEIIDYVSSLGHEGAIFATGDPAKGRAVYDAVGCAKCHSIATKGGNLGPDLSRVGALRGTIKLQKIMADPGGNLPLENSLQERAQYAAYLIYRAVMKDGKVIEGMRMNEDSFTVQLKDSAGQMHSVKKLETLKLEPQPGKSFMPDYKSRLTDTQMSDLIGYLSTLGGAQ